MVEKIDQKKCRDISTEIQETLAKWGKYFFYYYPKEHRIRPSEFAARHMGIVENVADLEHSILMDRIMEKEKLLKLLRILPWRKDGKCKDSVFGKRRGISDLYGWDSGRFTETAGICIGPDRTDQGRHTPE